MSLPEIIRASDNTHKNFQHRVRIFDTQSHQETSRNTFYRVTFIRKCMRIFSEV